MAIGAETDSAASGAVVGTAGCVSADDVQLVLLPADEQTGSDEAV